MIAVETAVSLGTSIVRTIRMLLTTGTDNPPAGQRKISVNQLIPKTHEHGVGPQTQHIFFGMPCDAIATNMKLRTNLLWMLSTLFISIIENDHLYLNAAFHIPYIFVTLLQLKNGYISEVLTEAHFTH